ncbi:hypothetical protein HBI56_188630 [Parastagonospora nodorum]|nr:hypothetical protein HBH52_160440 [Parastagonospora nodorum]KAH3997902.1 hypothetical protein HBI10_135200 [Parastagonospora nodorum]KAH4031270.1 hypothetical protein HBI09_122570 [Parastagonospora nodorum]KAH4047857.1 hypothetical protein HBH49_161220 [Parastagonospora nodorum]KAH4101947.1 hypothetical protein HBH46_132710 [Parastagonospora nodorum]
MDNHQGYSIFSSTPSQTQELIMEVAFASDKRAGLQELREAFVSLIGFHLVVRFPARA